MPNGSFVDLDRGIVGDKDLPSQDLLWQGELFFRQLEAVCGARLARTDQAQFDEVSRGTLYAFAYSAPNPVQLLELGTFDPFGGIFGLRGRRRSTRPCACSASGPTRDGGRRSRRSTFRWTGPGTRYRTWEKRMPSVGIHGGWTCEPGYGLPVNSPARSSSTPPTC